MNKKYKQWKESDIDFIKDNYKTMTDKQISSILCKITGDNISTDMVRRQRRKCNFQRPRGRPKT